MRTNRQKLEAEFYKNKYYIYSRGLENTVTNYWVMTSKFYNDFISEDNLWNVFEYSEKSRNAKAFGYEIFISNDENIKDFKLVMEFIETY